MKTLMTQQSLSTKQQSGRRSSSRAARRTQRLGESAQNSHLKVAYITRKIPPYDLLDEESLVNIEQASDTILAEIGIEFRDDAETVGLFREAGGQVTSLGDSASNIKFEPGMIREILKTAPPRFTQHARNPAKSVEIGGDAMVFPPAYGSPFILDMEQGRRYATPVDDESGARETYHKIMDRRLPGPEMDADRIREIEQNILPQMPIFRRTTSLNGCTDVR